MKRTGWFCWVLAAAACGCQVNSLGNGSNSAPRVGEVDRVQISAPLQAAVTLGKGPGPDGIIVRVNFWRTDPDHKLSVPVSGTLDVLLYDVPIQQIQTAQPFFKVSFDNPRLSSYLEQPVRWYGAAYDLVLGWGEHRPASKSVVIVACYHPPGNKTSVCSEPMSIPLGPGD